MSADTSVKSPAWIRPEDVMRVRKIKAKKKALQARMISSTTSLRILAPTHSQANVSLGQDIKRRNPFRFSPNKKSRHDEDSHIEAASDASLFRLLNTTEGKDFNTLNSQESFNFTSFFRKELGASTTPDEESAEHVWTNRLSVDWSLKSRVRFKSHKALPWKHNFKALEKFDEATTLM
ncbi:hypothetical protein SK128_010309 [Halocaridina rubra]|uniref:Uncharacterized protein n=1 Tax=Halocaridina rubra TaxID=373956 RepID=A0AAN9A053_HALRR